MKKFKIVFLLVMVFTLFNSFGQAKLSQEGHGMKVNEIVSSSENLFSVGSDGMLIKWNDYLSGERFQVSDNDVQLLAVSPSGNELAFYETKTGLNNQVVLWNAKTNSVKYAFTFDDPVNSIAFSGKGTYLIVTTNTSNGIFFIKTQSGQMEQKIKENVGIIGFTQTGSSEKNILLYSILGNVYYYDLVNNKIILKAKAEADLQKISMFKNSYLASVKNNCLYFVDIRPGKTFGKTSFKYQGNKPVISGSDENIYFFDSQDKEETLNRISLTEKGFLKPEILYTFSTGKDRISSAQFFHDSWYAGSESGTIYRLSAEQIYDPETLEAFSTYIVDKTKESAISKILSADVFGDDYYFLTKQALIKSNGSHEVLSVIPNDYDFTDLCAYNDKILLWKNDQHSEIYCLDTETGNLEKIYSTDNRIQKIKRAMLAGSYSFVEIEGNAKVNLIDLTSDQKVTLLFSGTGIQDALYYGKNSVYIAKTSSSRPQGALLYINTKTKETVPQIIPGNIVYDLELSENLSQEDLPEITNTSDSNITEAQSLDSKTQKLCMYGLMISDKSTDITTTLFAFDPQSKKYQSLLEIKSQDSEAFLRAAFPRLYTNLGSREINSVYSNGSRKTSLKRTSGVQIKVIPGKDSVMVLNKDGTASIYKNDQTQAQSLWTITNENQIEAYNF